MIIITDASLCVGGPKECNEYPGKVMRINNLQFKYVELLTLKPLILSSNPQCNATVF